MTERRLPHLPSRPKRIVAYVGRDGRLQEFYARVLPLLDYLLPQYIAEGKAHLVVAIGCTGGRHRSVHIVDLLARNLTASSGNPAEQREWRVTVTHRELEREGLTPAQSADDAGPGGDPAFPEPPGPSSMGKA